MSDGKLSLTHPGQPTVSSKEKHTVKRILLSTGQLALLGIMAAVPAWSGAQQPSLPYETFVVSPAITNHAILPDAPLPAPCRAGLALRVTACRGEYEPTSFVIETAQPLSQVHVTVTDLRSETDVIASKAVDVRVVAPVFRYATDFPATMNWVLVYDPNLIAVRNEPQPRAKKPDASEVDRAHRSTNYFTREPVDTPVLQPADC